MSELPPVVVNNIYPMTYEAYKNILDRDKAVFEWLKVAKYYGVCRDIREEIYFLIAEEY